MTKSRIVLIGCVRSSEYFLNLLIHSGYAPVGIVTKGRSDFNSDFTDLAPICEASGIPYIHAADHFGNIECGKLLPVESDTEFNVKKSEFVFLPFPQNVHSERRKSPFPHSKEVLLAQARYRGSSCYCEYAEKFQIVKEIIICQTKMHKRTAAYLYVF